MTKLILIRHGETDYNLQKRFCGSSNPGLNAKGIQQAESLAVHLRDVRVDKVYTSDLQRAIETARIIFKDLPCEELKEFREMHFGVFENLTHDEITRKYSAIYSQWLDNPYAVDIPEGERLADFQEKVCAKLKEIVHASNGKNIALVTHGGTARVIICDILKYSQQEFWRISLENASLNIIEYINGSAAVVKPEICHILFV